MDYEKLWHELKERLFAEAEQNLDDHMKFYVATYVTKVMSEMVERDKHLEFANEN